MAELTNLKIIPKFSIVRGDEFFRIFQFSMPHPDDPDGLDPETYPPLPFDLTGFTQMLCDFRDKPDEAEGVCYVSLKDEDGLSVIGDDNDGLGMFISSAKSNEFKPNTTPHSYTTVVEGARYLVTVDAVYYYDIRLLVNDSVRTWLTGTMEVISNITKIE